MATAREENRYEGGEGYGKFRKRPFRKTQTTPYDRPPTALRNPSRNNGWLSKIVDPAQRIIQYSAHRLFSSVFRKRLPAPPSDALPPPLEDSMSLPIPEDDMPPPLEDDMPMHVPMPTPPKHEVELEDVAAPNTNSETVQEVRENHQEVITSIANESSGKQQIVGESSVQINRPDGGGLTELEKLLKQKTFTRSEIDHLTELMHSRTVNALVGEEGKRTEVVPSDSVLPRDQKEKYHRTSTLENGIENHLVSTPRCTSSVCIEDVASPAELAKAYMGSRPSKVSPSMLSLRSPPSGDSILLKDLHFAQKSPIMSIVPRATNLTRVRENGFATPRSRGRSAIYNMARTPYSRVYPTSTHKGAGVGIEGEPSSSSQHALDHDILSGSKQGALKRRSSVLDNDIGSFGPIRRIRQKSNLISSNKGLTSHHLGSSPSIARSGIRNDAAWQPSSSMQKPMLSGEVRHSHKKLSMENVDDTVRSTSFHPLPSKSSETASKILQQLDRLASPTKLSSSMLRGQALRSMEIVDSSKLLDNVQDIQFHGTSGNQSASAQKLTPKVDKVENGPTKFVSPTNGLIPVDTDPTVPRNQAISVVKSGDLSVTEPVSYPPQKKRAFRMSAHEDYLELDDDAYPNGSVSPFSTSGKETIASTSTTLAEKSASATEKPASEMPPGSSVVMSSKNLTADDKLLVRVADGSIVDEKVAAPTPIISSVAADFLLKPTTSPVKASSMHTILGSDRSTSLNGSVANPPLFNFGEKAVTSTDLAAADAPLKEYTKEGPTFSLDKATPTKEPGADAPPVNFGINKKLDSVPQVPFTYSSSVGGESTGVKFGGASDSKLKSISSTTAAGAVDSIPSALELNNADAKSNIVSGFSARASEQASSAAASTSLLTPPTSVITFGNGSNKNNGTAVSSPAFSSPFPPMITNTLTSQSIFGGPSLASTSSISATATSTSTGMTFSTPAVIASSNSSSSAPVAASSSATNTTSKFGSTLSPSTSLLVSSGSEPVETKIGQFAGFGNTGSTPFGSSSAAVGSTGSGIFGFSASATTSVSSQSQGSFFGTTSGSTPSSGFATSNQSQSVAFGSTPSSSFATSNQSQSVAFGSSASPVFGLTGNAAFSSGSSSFPSSSPATNTFNSGTTSGQSTATPSLEANPVSSNNGTSSTSFGISSWPPSKSPFGTNFSSTPSTSGFPFGSSTPSASTSSSMIFGSSTSASGPQFSFTSAAATPNMQPASTNTQPAFGSSAPGFAFGSASVNNDQMSMEDSMAEDTVQATPPATPVFGQQPAPVQSNFAFGAPSPTPANPFQFVGQQIIAPQNPSPFQASGSLEFNAGGSFSLGTGGNDKSGRRIVKVKHRPRKK